MSIEPSGATGAGNRCGFHLDADGDDNLPSWIDPEAEIEDHPECRHEVLEGHDRCGLHLPVGERPGDFDETAAVRRRFEAALDDRSPVGGRLNFVGVRLESRLVLAAFATYLDHEQITALDFRYARLAGVECEDGEDDGSAAWGDMDLTVALDFDHVIVGRVDLSGAAAVREPISLRRATVGDDPGADAGEPSVKLIGLDYVEKVTLDGARLHGDLRLSHVDELGALSATEAEVSGVITLDRTAIGDGGFDGEKLSCRNFSATPSATLENASFRKLEAQTLDLAGAEVTAHGEGGISFRNLTVRGNCTLNRVTLRDRGEFNEAFIGGSVRMDDGTFDDGIDFTDASIEGEECSLYGASSGGPVVFEEAAIEGTLHAERGTFTDDVAFGGVSIGDRAYLTNGLFERTVDFAGATIGGAECKLDVDEDVTHERPGDGENKPPGFEGPVVFEGATIEGTLSVENCEFADEVTFRRATLHGDVIGTNATTAETDGSEITFTDATVRGLVDFYRATVTQGNFDRADFYGPVFFDEATLGPVQFNDATFHADSYFRSVVDGQPTKARVFQDDVELRGATFDGVADFRIFESASERAVDRADADGGDEPASRRIDNPRGRYRGLTVATDPCVVGGDLDAVEASLTYAKLTGFQANGEIDLLDADLSHARLQNATLRGAVLERGVLNHCNLFGADLTDAKLYGAVFEGTRIDDDTTIVGDSSTVVDRVTIAFEQFGYRRKANGEQLWYHREAAEAADDDVKLNLYNRAISTYSQLETLARENGQLPLARSMFVGKKDARRARVRVESGACSWQWIGAALKKAVMNYGESWRHVVGVSALLVVLLAVLFPFAEFSHATAGDLDYGEPSAVPRTLFYATLYSLASFTSLGSDDFETGLAVDLLATFQSAAGILMLGLLLFVLQRRTAR